MATQSCLNNIKKKQPPTYCGESICGQIQGDINEYCEHNGLGGDVPVPQFGPNGKCWCCCSCVAWGTPIEVTPGNFMAVEDICTGTSVMATGGKMNGWQQIDVTSVGGIKPGTPLSFCYTAFFKMADNTQRIIVSTADHLYLVPNGVLKPIQDLRPGSKVVQADGSLATVQTVLVGEFSGGVRNFSLGEFEPEKHPDDPYKGHLVNTFGLVTADLAVQVAFYGEKVDQRLIAQNEPDLPHIGSTKFFEQYDTTFHNEVLRTPAMWPRGFKPLISPLVNIPISALAYFTPGQAEDLFNVHRNQNLGNSEALAHFKYLRRLFRGFFPDFYYVADWSSDVPNAWYFNSGDQNYVVVSGGMLRLPTLGLPGLTAVMTHLIAKGQGRGCTGDADYWGAAVILRDLWFDEVYFDYYPSAVEQIAATFALVNPEHAKPDPLNICAEPGLDCRLQALRNAGRFGGVPACAKPLPDFAVTGASALGLDQVKVTFSVQPLAESATVPSHYQINGISAVLQVRLDADKNSVVLIVQKLAPATEYHLTVTDVVSVHGQFLSPSGNYATFRTP